MILEVFNGIKILEYLDIPISILPEVMTSSSNFGEFQYKGFSIPINGVAGDQQAALFGQAFLRMVWLKILTEQGVFFL